MSSNPVPPVELTLTVSAEEQAELLRLLEQALGDTRVEVHHTHTPDYRDHVLHQERLIRGLLDKVRRLQA
jgi:hypothetical protein